MPSTPILQRVWLLVVAGALIAKLGAIREGDPLSDLVALAAELFLMARRYTIEDTSSNGVACALLAGTGSFFIRWLRRPNEQRGVNPFAKFFAMIFLWLLFLSTLAENRVAPVYLLPLLSSEQCDEIIRAAEDAAGGVGWTTTRHRQYATEDLPLARVPIAEAILQPLLQRELFPLVATRFCGGRDACSPTLSDGFIVRYRTDRQPSLEMHRDGHHVSFNLALSAAQLDYFGGGSRFKRLPEVIRAPKGHALVHGAALEHAGEAITHGARYLVVGFLTIADAPPAGGSRVNELAWSAQLALTRLWGGLATEVRLATTELSTGLSSQESAYLAGLRRSF